MRRQIKTSSSSGSLKRKPLTNNYMHRDRSDSSKSNSTQGRPGKRPSTSPADKHSSERLYYAFNKKTEVSNRNVPSRSSQGSLQRDSRPVGQIRRSVDAPITTFGTLQKANMAASDKPLSSRVATTKPQHPGPAITAQTYAKLRNAPSKVTSLRLKYPNKNPPQLNTLTDMPSEHLAQKMMTTTPQAQHMIRIENPTVPREYRSVERDSPKTKRLAKKYQKPLVEMVTQEALHENVVKLRESLIGLRNLQKKMSDAVQSLGKTCYYAKKQSKMEKQMRSEEQDMQPTGPFNQHFDQLTRQVNSEVSRINQCLNEVSYAMLSTDDLVFALQSSVQKGIDTNQSLHKLVKLETDHRKLLKEYEEVQDQLVQTRITNNKHSTKIKDLDDKLYLKQFQVDGLQKMLEECRQDNHYLVAKVEEAGKTRRAPKLAQQASNFLDAMKDLQKMLKEGEKSSRVKEAKQRFEVCQKLLEQGIRQAGKVKTDLDCVLDRPVQYSPNFGQQSSKSNSLEQCTPVQVEVRATRISDEETLKITVDSLQRKLLEKTQQLKSDEAELQIVRSRLMNSETQMQSLQTELNGLLDKKCAELNEQLEANAALTETNIQLEKQIAANAEDEANYQELMKHHLESNNKVSQLSAQNAELELARTKLQAMLEQNQQNSQELKRNLKIRHDEELEDQSRRHEQELAELRQSQAAVTAGVTQDTAAENHTDTVSELQKEIDSLKNQIEIKKTDGHRMRMENQSQAQQINRQNNSLTLMRQQITMLETMRSQKAEVKEVPVSCLCQFPLWALAKDQWSNGLVRMRHDGLPKLIQWARLQGDTIVWSQIADMQQRLVAEKEEIETEAQQLQIELQKVTAEQMEQEELLNEKSEELNKKVLTCSELEGQLSDLKQELDKAKMAHAEQVQQLNTELNESKQNYNILQTQLAEMERQIEQIRDDTSNSTAQEMLKNQQAMNDLNIDLGIANQHISDLQDQIDQKADQVTKLQEKARSLEEQSKTKDQELQSTYQQQEAMSTELEEVKQAHNLALKALESDRDNIRMLKDTVSKGIQKQREQAAELTKAQKELAEAKRTSQAPKQEAVESIVDNAKLREEFQAKVDQMEDRNAQLLQQCDEKESLMIEANRAIEEAQEELHDVKAKLKHLVQVHYHGLSYSADLSSYKGDDSSLSINICLDQIQSLLTASNTNVTILRNMDELKATLAANNQQLAKAKEIIQKYKKKLASAAKDKNNDSDSDSENLQAENLELLGKLQSQETQLSQLRNQLAAANKGGDQELLKALESRMEELRGKIDQALIQKAEINAIGYFKHYFEGEDEPVPNKTLAELREEVLDLAQQLADNKIDLMERDKAVVALEQKDIQSLRDDVNYYQTEHLELSLKCKALVIRNNQIIEELKQAKAVQSKKEADLGEKSFDLSIIEASSKEKVDELMADSDGEEERKASDPVQDEHYATGEKIEEFIRKLGVQEAVTLPEKLIKKIVKFIVKKSGKDIQTQELDASDSSENASDVFGHVKSNLTIYLKRQPIVDEAGESVLKIVFSMMKMSFAEQNEIQAARDNLPVYVIDSAKTKKKAKSRNIGLTSVSQNSSKDSQEKKVANKLAKGISSLFSMGSDSKLKVKGQEYDAGKGKQKTESMGSMGSDRGQNSAQPVRGPMSANRVDESMKRLDK